MSREKKLVSVPTHFTPAFWEHADGRSAIVKEIRRRVDVLKADAGADSTQKVLLCERAAFVALQLESWECTATETGKLDSGIYTQSVNTLLGLLRALGLEKNAKRVGGLDNYLKERSA